MLVVKTQVKPSSIEGRGLFAAEHIQKGTVIWRFDPTVDCVYTKEEIMNLPEPKRSEILSLKYSYISRDIGKYVDCGDDAKYINHSDTPNLIVGKRVRGQESDGIAARDIEAGEEITYDYREFDEPFLFSDIQAAK